MLSGTKVLVTGATGSVALPVVLALTDESLGNDVWATARFTDEKALEELDAAGVTCVAVDLVETDLSALPTDFDHVLNFAVMKTNDWDTDLAGNVGGLGELMFHCRSARAFLHCSSTAVYRPNGRHRFCEDDPLGDNHGVSGSGNTYSISKIAAESMARFCARHLDLPTTIARLNVPYGDRGNWPGIHLDSLLDGKPVPVGLDQPTEFNPIHDDDIAGQLDLLLDAASVPATVVNWGGDEAVSIEEWCAFMGQLVGVEPSFLPTDQHIDSVTIDTKKRMSITGPCSVGWKEGFARMISARRPERLV